jgi:sirohydrochlorin ferrochelatase
LSIAIILFAHGSRVESANEAVRKVAAELASAGEYALVEAAFLELGKPDLAGAVSAVAAKGAKRVVVIPYFLTMGTHLRRDLPRLIDGVALAHPNLEIRITPPLDGHPALVRVLLDLAKSGISSVSD